MAAFTRLGSRFVHELAAEEEEVPGAALGVLAERKKITAAAQAC